MRVEVTQAHIDEANRLKRGGGVIANRCPIALAVRSLGYPTAWFGVSWLGYDYSIEAGRSAQIYESVQSPPEADKWATDWDFGRPVAPAVFEFPDPVKKGVR